MDDNFIDDDFGRKPGTRPDYDVEAGNMVRDFRSTPDEVHDQHYESAKEALPELLKNEPAASEVLNNAQAAYCVDEDSPEAKAVHAAHAREAAAANPDATNASGLESPTAPAAAPADTSFEGSGPNSSSGGAPGDGGSAEKPTSLESSLSAIRLNGERQQRLVISGDPMIERAFYEKLAERGQVFYQGGAPVITISRDKAIKVLLETAKEFEGASGQHAMSLAMDRDGGGILGTIKAGLQNNLLGRRHEIDVVVVGKPDVVDAKLKEIGSLVTAMERAGHVGEGSASLADGKLKLSEGKPAELDGTARLYDLLTAVKNKVETYNNEQSGLQKDIKEWKQEQDAGKLEKHRRENGEDAGAAAGKASPERPNQHAQKLVDHIDKGFQDPNLLRTQNGKGQVEALAMLQQSRGLKDPSERELQSLPDATRQKAIVQMAALIEKVDAKDFGDKLGKELDKSKADSSSIREKVADYITMEAKRDTQFGEKVQPLLKDMVERNILTEKQAESITGKVAEAVTASKEAAAKEAPSADAPKAADLSKDAATVEAGKDKVPTLLKDMVEKGELTETQAQFATGKMLEAAAAADAKNVTTPAADGKAPSADSSSALDANSASRAEGAKQDRVEPNLGDAATGQTTQASTTKVAGETPGPDSDKPLNLRDRIEALAKDGAANLTVEKAHALVADLDGIRSKPLTALDGGKGTEPTRTLVRAEALLKELETGRFGAELQSQAKDLTEPLQKWEKQDVSRFNNDASVTTLSRDDVVAGVKTGLSKFESAEPTAQKDAAAPAPAPSKDQASAEQSAPANPEKASATTASGAAQETASSAQSEVKQAPAVDAAAVAAKELAATRMTETESAGGKLSMMMANPAGSFTNRDKTWNLESFHRAANEVLRIDPESVAQMSGPQRAKLAAFSAWIAENAREGKVPGFSSEEGKAQASQLVERAAALIGKMDEGSKLSPDVQKSLTKADNMVNAMEQLQKSASATSQTSHEQVSRGGISSNAASALAKDLVHSVYRQPEMSDAQAKYLLKNAANLTPETTKAMDPQTRAQTAVAMGHLAQQVRDGAMGDFSKLPSSVQKNVVAASNAAENMLTQMGKDPSMRAELNQAYSELHAKTAGTSKTAGASATKVDGMEQSTGTSPSAAKSTDASATKVDTEVTKADAGASKAAAPAASKSDGRSHDR